MLYQGNYCREEACQGRIQNSGGEGGEGQDLKHITQYLLESDEAPYNTAWKTLLLAWNQWNTLTKYETPYYTLLFSLNTLLLLKATN